MKLGDINLSTERMMVVFQESENARAGSTLPIGWARALLASLRGLRPDYVLMPAQPTDAAVEAICKVLDPDYGIKMDMVLLHHETHGETDEEFAERLLDTRRKARAIYAALIKID